MDKELAQKLMEIKGECRGITIKTDWDYIFRIKGREGVKKIEEKMAELGYPLKYEEIKTMDFYPIGYDAISILLIKEIFNFTEKDLENMGREETKSSLFFRLLIRYLISLKTFAKEVPKTWKKHYSIGDLQVSEIDDKNKYAVLKLKNFSLHPEFCQILKGYFAETLKILTGASEVICKETKCTFKGDPEHEFYLTWK
jgi:predicted hydrocarbon binding protein